jgi:hypothetical protein
MLNNHCHRVTAQLQLNKYYYYYYHIPKKTIILFTLSLRNPQYPSVLLSVTLCISEKSGYKSFLLEGKLVKYAKFAVV